MFKRAERCSGIQQSLTFSSQKISLLYNLYLLYYEEREVFMLPSMRDFLQALNALMFPVVCLFLEMLIAAYPLVRT